MINDKTIPSFIEKILPSPRRKRRDIFIAGGFVVNPPLALDVDLWFPFSLLPEIQKKAKTFDFTPSTEIYEPSGAESILTLGTVITEEGTHPIHLLVTGQTVFSVLEGFDLSVHQIAETLDGFTVMGPRYTYPTEEIEVLGYWTPNRTLARYQKLCARYGLEVNLDEVKRLEDKIESTDSPF